MHEEGQGRVMNDQEALGSLKKAYEASGNIMKRQEGSIRNYQELPGSTILKKASGNVGKSLEGSSIMMMHQ